MSAAVGIPVDRLLAQLGEAGLPEKGVHKLLVAGIEAHVCVQQTVFDLMLPDAESPVEIVLNMPGRHNVLNALASICVAHELGISIESIRQALKKFQGIGRRLLERAAEWAARRRYDLLGTAYGVEPSLLSFWQAAGFVAVRLGVRVDSASAAHSLFMLRGLCAAGNELAASARHDFQADLPWALAASLRDLDSSLALRLLRGRRSRVDEERKGAPQRRGCEQSEEKMPAHCAPRPYYKNTTKFSRYRILQQKRPGSLTFVHHSAMFRP